MLIITLRTDKPEAEIGIYEDQQQLSYTVWEAHRQLAETVHTMLETVLRDQTKTLQDIQGIVVFQGPGSFTGLRIGLTVANTLSYGLQVPIIGTQDANWIDEGIRKIMAAENHTVVLPEYGALPNITSPRK